MVELLSKQSSLVPRKAGVMEGYQCGGNEEGGMDVVEEPGRRHAGGRMGKNGEREQEESNMLRRRTVDEHLEGHFLLAACAYLVEERLHSAPSQKTEGWRACEDADFDSV